MNSIFRSAAALFAVLAFLMPGLAQAQTYRDVDFPGDEAIYPVGVNFGTIVGIYYDAQGNINGFSRSARGAYETINLPQAQLGTYPVAVDERLDIAGYYYDANYTSHGFVRYRNGYVVTIDFPAASALYGTTVAAMNGQGAVIGFYTDDANVEHGFLRTANGKTTVLDVPSALYTQPASINSKGSITGTYGAADGSVGAFIRSPSGTYSYFQAPGINSAGFQEPLIMDDENRVVGTVVDSQGHTHGFVRSPEGIATVFDYPGASYTEFVGIDCYGNVAGLYLGSSGNHGLIMSPNGHMKSFDFPGTTVSDTTVRAMSAQGVIVGTWSNLEGQVHGFERLSE
jgi:uncharacterized membrane protein